MGKTSIEWVRGTDGSEGFSWNALRAVRKDESERNGRFINASANHCEHVNEACRYCYADRMNPRLGGLPFKPGHRGDYDFIVDYGKLTEPLRKRKPARIFVESMSDAFGEWWPDRYIDQLYAVMSLTPQHTYINLSKRPKRRMLYRTAADMAKRVSLVAATMVIRFDEDTSAFGAYDRLKAGLPNVIEGTSVSCQEEADDFVPLLLQTPAAVRCLSCEPLLGPIDVGPMLAGALHWVIVGGESGQRARPMSPEWARSLRDQCDGAGVKFFFKQWGEWAPLYRGDGKPRKRFMFDDGMSVHHVGKAIAGRLLDGREHNDFPA